MNGFSLPVTSESPPQKLLAMNVPSAGTATTAPTIRKCDSPRVFRTYSGRKPWTSVSESPSRSAAARMRKSIERPKLARVNGVVQVGTTFNGCQGAVRWAAGAVHASLCYYSVRPPTGRHLESSPELKGPQSRAEVHSHEPYRYQDFARALRLADRPRRGSGPVRDVAQRMRRKHRRHRERAGQCAEAARGPDPVQDRDHDRDRLPGRGRVPRRPDGRGEVRPGSREDGHLPRQFHAGAGDRHRSARGSLLRSGREGDRGRTGDPGHGGRGPEDPR